MSYERNIKFTTKIPTDSGYVFVRTMARTKHDDVVKLFFAPSKPDAEKYLANLNPPVYASSPWECLNLVRAEARRKKNPVYATYIMFGDKPITPLSE